MTKEKLLGGALKSIEKGNLDRALRFLERLAAADPRDARVWMRIGEVHTRRADVQGACRAYARAAAIFRDQGYRRRELAVLKNIVSLAPSSVEARRELARGHADAGHPQQALHHLEQILRQRPNDAETRMLMDQLANASSAVTLPPPDGLEPTTQVAPHPAAHTRSASGYVRVLSDIDDLEIEVCMDAGSPIPFAAVDDRQTTRPGFSDTLIIDKTRTLRDDNTAIVRLADLDPGKDRASAKAPNMVEQLLDECHVLLEKMAEKLIAAVDLAPRNRVARERLAYVLMQLGRPQEALAHLVAIDGDTPVEPAWSTARTQTDLVRA